MTNHLQQIREKIAKRLKELRPKAKDGRIAGGDMDPLLAEMRKQFPDLPVWEMIPHPRDNHFNIYILPLPNPLPETLQPAMRDLHNQMSHDGIAADRQLSGGSAYEKRITHLWVAEIQRWTYHPIGICTFLEEEREGGRQLTTWLSFVWLNPAQRHHNVLRNSVPYFEKWHRRFVVARDHAIINKSLKDYPDHLQNMGATGSFWQ